LRAFSPRGSWVRLADVTGLDFDPVQAALLGCERPHGAILRIEPTSGWIQVLGQVADAGLEGLAYDAASSTVYAASATTGLLHRFPLATAVAEAVGEVQGLGVTPRGVRALAFGRGTLFGLDRATGTLVSIDRTSAAATMITTTPGFPEISGLAYDAARDRLLAYSDATGAVLGLRPDPGSLPELLTDVLPALRIGGLAWIPDSLRLLGTDLDASSLVTLLQLVPPGLGFGDVQSLAFPPGAPHLTGCDGTARKVVEIDPVTGKATERPGFDGLRILGMAEDPATGSIYAADAATQNLYLIDAGGTMTRVGAEGALGTHDVRALAFDGLSDPVVLYGFDAASSRLVTIDLATGVPTPIWEAMPGTAIEALGFDDLSRGLLAIDAATRDLLHLDLAAQRPHVLGQVEFADVRGMALPPGLDEIWLVDADRDELAIVSRFTGETLRRFDEPRVHRGAASAKPIALLWPRGDVRKEGLGTFAVDVGADFAGGRISFRIGERVLYEAEFDPENVAAVVPIPPSVREAVACGDEVAWAVVDRGGSVVEEARFTLVAVPAAETALRALAARPYVASLPLHVRAAIRSRELASHGLFTEALAEAIAAGRAEPGYVPAQRRLVEALRGLLGKKQGDAAFQDSAVVRAQRAGPAKR